MASLVVMAGALWVLPHDDFAGAESASAPAVPYSFPRDTTAALGGHSMHCHADAHVFTSTASADLDDVARALCSAVARQPALSSLDPLPLMRPPIA